MLRRLLTIGLATLTLAALAATSAVAQTPPAYEVRTFLDDTTDGTYQYRQSCVKQRYVCPYCSYSSPNPGTCPNPWSATGHPSNVTLRDMQAERRLRVLSLAVPDMTTAGQGDLQLYDSAGTVHNKAVLGRPFQPQDVDTTGSADTRRSTLHVKMAGVTNNTPLGNQASRFRFLIIPPTPQNTVAGAVTKGRRPMAQVDTDLTGTPPRGMHLVSPTTDTVAGITNATLSNYLEVHLNPYRVDEGDTWWVRYTEQTHNANQILSARVEVYSILYGLMADLDYNPNGNNQITFGFSLVTENGAAVIKIPRMWHSTDTGTYPWPSNSTHTWTVQFMTRSNCRMMPNWADLVNETDDPPFTDLAGNTHGDAGFALGTPGNFPAAKKCWLNNVSGTVEMSDTSKVVETSKAPAPYVIPNNLTGQGTVAVEYGKQPTGNWSPNIHQDQGADAFFYIGGGEWQYDAVELVNNADLNTYTAHFSTTAPQKPYVQYIGARFLVSRTNIAPTGNTWEHPNAATSENAELDSGTEWAYPRVIIGLLSGLIVRGDYPPGSITPYRYYSVFNRWNSSTAATMYCPTCGAVWGPDSSVPADGKCPYHTPAVALATLSAISGGAYYGYVDQWRSAVANGVDERVSPATTALHLMPPSSFEYSNTWVGVTAAYKRGGTAVQAVDVRIPRYQPPSVPAGATNGVNNPANDRGYRGGCVVYRSTTVSGATGMTSGWDAFYRCPDCGAFINANDPASHSCGSAHKYCPICGAECDASYTICPFDGGVPVAPNPPNPTPTRALSTITPTLACRYEHLQAEEFDACDLQVSVNRKAEVASTLAATEIGRTSPGTPALQPDTTSAALTGHMAYPSDVSPLAPFLMRNEGNVNTPVRIGNVYDFTPSYADQALFDYHRVELCPLNYSLGRLGQAAPITRDTFRPFNNALTATATWALLPASGSDPSGRETPGYITAGTYSTPAKPLPFGQPVGVYTGEQIQYIDSDGDGALDFMPQGSTTPTTTASTRFDPAHDTPLEPVCSVVPGALRVTETRLPHNDYYARDTEPVPLINMADSKLQVIWGTNRASTDPAVNSTAAPGQPAAAGTGPGDLPTASSPQNLVYATATGVTGGTNDPLYRGYFWPSTGGVLDEANMLTADGAGTVNSAPWAMLDAAGTYRWAFWHRSQGHAGGVESTLRFDSSTGSSWAWSGSGPTEFIYDTGLPKQNLRGFMNPSTNAAWLFWHTGPQGRERLMYRWEFDGTTSNHEAPAPVSNQAPGGRGNDGIQTLDPNSSAYWTVQRPSSSPFTYTKDPSVFLNGGVVNLFFSGYLRQEEQSDICWTRYNLAEMAQSTPAAPRFNYGKLAFGALSWEETKPDGLRQRFGTRHLDWLVAPGFENTPVAQVPYATTPNPSFRLALAYDNAGDGAAPVVQRFTLTWRAADNGEYDRQRGVYRVRPILYPISGSVLPSAVAMPVSGSYSTSGPWYLRDPNSTTANPRPLMLEIDPAAGVLQFSAPLYNQGVEEFRRLQAPTAPWDPTTVFNSTVTRPSGGEALADVLIETTYTPYVWRVTRNSAQDDSPSAFWNSAAQRLVVFWRRSYQASEAPHFGRASFMYRVLTNAVQVGRPPVTGTPTFTDLTVGGTVTPLSGDDNSGVYVFDGSRDGHYLQVAYGGVGGNYTERQQVVGWSTENVVPVDTVIGEGPLVAVPESYTVPGNGGATLPATRYWLFWGSPRAVYDLRLVENPNNTRYQPTAGNPPDLPVHGSTDICTAVVAPDLGTIRPERILSSVSTDPS